MFNKSRVIGLFVALAFVFVLAGAAAQQSATPQKTTKECSQETVICPVSGEKINKAEAKISWEYKGKTYYFCCEECKAKFMKDPESYLQKKPEGKSECKDVYVCPKCQDVKSDKPGKCPKCGMDLVKMEPGKDIIIKKVQMEGPMHEKGMMMEHEPGMPGMMMHRGIMAHGLMGGCPLTSKDVDFKVEYIKDGVVVTVTSKNIDTVKIIQGHAAMMKQRCQAGCQDQGIKKEVVIKEEIKKEPDKK